MVSQIIIQFISLLCVHHLISVFILLIIGFVVDENSKAIPNAAIVVQGIEKNITSTSRGEYWRLLTPGKYVVYASAYG